MDLTRQFIKNKIMFQHMVPAERQVGVKYFLFLTFRFIFWMKLIYDKREIIII